MKRQNTYSLPEEILNMIATWKVLQIYIIA